MTYAPKIFRLVELRQYTTRPGARDALVELFDREFVEAQETKGLSILGQFRDLDRPDRFVWLRGFEDPGRRAEALGDFYDGPVWRTHREAANATLIDSDNVLQLKPLLGRFPPSHRSGRRGVVVGAVYPVAGDREAFARMFVEEAAPLLAEAGAPVMITLATDAGPNPFPRLPVREGENVFVWLAPLDGPERWADAQAALAGSRRWTRALQQIERRLSGAPETLRLEPTERSGLR